MASELNMYESQVNEYKYEIERIARELQEVKKKYFMQKKKESQQKYVFNALCTNKIYQPVLYHKGVNKESILALFGVQRKAHLILDY